MTFRKKRFIIPLIILVVLIAARFYLPTFLKNYINKTLSNIPGYYGQVAQIDVALYRGAYTIHNLYLNKVGATEQVPFLDFNKTDISIQWRSLLKGKIVSEIDMYRPKLIYTLENQQQTNGADTDVDDWTKALKDIIPIDINRLSIENGMLAFVEVTANPTIDLNIDQLNLEATNLRNVDRSGKELPSDLKASGVSIGKGKLSIDGKLDILREIPDMDISVKLEDADVTSLNDFTSHYAKIDFDSGQYSIFGEMAIANGYMQGYVKPILTELKFHTKGEDKFLETLWEGFVGFFKFVFKNQRKQTLATKVNFEGDLNNVGTKPLQTVFNTLKNAWIKAYKTTVDDSIDFEGTEEESVKAEK